MSKARILLAISIISSLVLLVATSQWRGLRAQGCPPGQTWVCVTVCDPLTGACSEHCSCCASGGTPGATGEATAFPVTPPATATPLPENHVILCATEDCPPGETRLTHLVYDPMMATLYLVEHLETCCGPSCPCGEPTEMEQPCTPGSGWVTCSEFDASVQADLPVWHADREPYPRALVTVPETVWVTDLSAATRWGSAVNPGGDACGCRADGSCEDDPPPEGTMCAYRLGLRIEPGSEPPTWRFEDCGTRMGPSVQCGWSRSSWGKPERGVGMAPDCPALPAYSVRATVPYWWSLGRQWEAWEQVGQDCDCGCKVCEDPGGCSDECDCHGDGSLCTQDDEFCDQDCDPIYGWRHHGPNWVLLDLTDHGWSTPYMLNPNVQLVPHPPCEPNPPVGAIYVPCIEVQAPIEGRP